MLNRLDCMDEVKAQGVAVDDVAVSGLRLDGNGDG